MPRHIAESFLHPASPSNANIDSGALDISSSTEIHPQGIMEMDLQPDLPNILEGSPGPWNHSQSN